MKTVTEAAGCEVSAEELSDFAAGRLTGAPRRRILEHLLRGCASCRHRIAEIQRPSPAAEAGDESAEPGSEARLGDLLRDLTERRDRMEAERREASQLLAAFLGHPVARQWTMLRNSARYTTYSFTTALIDAAFDAILDDPRRSHALAEMAVELAARIDPAPYTRRIVIDLQARAAAHLANAERAMGDLARAQRTLARARALLDDGSLDPLLEGEIHYLEASLLRAQRRLDAALRRVRAGLRIFSDLGEPVWWARCLVNEGSILSVQGDLEGSLRAARRAVEIADTTGDPRLALSARHGLVWATMESGRPTEALELLARVRPAYQSIGDGTTGLRLRWLEARLFQQVGRADAAAAAYRATVEGFAAAALPYEVANVSLDWALLAAENGRAAEVAAIAGTTLEIFRGLGIEEGALAAWLLFQRSAQAGAVTSALIEKLAAYYREARVRPGAVFAG